MDNILIRSAEYRGSYDPETGTIEAVISTYADVKRKEFIERLDPQGLDTSNLVGIPVLDSHKQGSTRDIIGAVQSVRTEGQNLVAIIKLSGAADVASTVQKIREGIIRGTSIGYAVTKWAESIDPQSRQKVKTATAWQIREVSAVAVPADQGATFRSQEMSKVNELEEGRADLIKRCGNAHNLGEDWETRMTEAGDALSDDDIRQAARDAAAEKRQAQKPAQIRTAAPQNEDPAQLIERQAEALACRMSGTAPSDAARQYMNMGLHDMARDALARAGVSIRGLSTEEMLTRAAHGTSDFTELTTGAGNRVLAASYAVAQSVLKQVARQRSMADFRASSTLKIGEFSGLEPVSEHGEIKAMTTAEAKESYALETFGGSFALTRKAIINDDLGAFARWGEMMGRAAAETEAKQLLALLAQNSGNGPKMGEDGKNLFHADHGNLASAGSALSETSLSDARKALRTQKGLDGKTPISVVPKYLVVGPALETVAEKLLATIQANRAEDVNPFGGKLTLLVEPRITTNNWLLFADPATAPVLEYAYLASAPGPQLSSRDGWETLGREFRVVLDFGCGAVDWRGAYRNAGA